ncbi:globin family protein [Algihabitans albus]|uniref:hypothetical protein n=1 Tax=Algihabitans albus TaxID=2164067 RepID=UPI000E5DA3E9|nr:hypothetical protein [Algihabitans albus]
MMPRAFPVKRRPRRCRPPEGQTAAYRQLWRIVDGAVRATFEAHPEYLTPAGRARARRSIVKRVTGQLLGYAVQTAQARSGASPARDTAGESYCSPAQPRQAYAAAGRQASCKAPAGHVIALTLRRWAAWWRRS